MTYEPVYYGHHSVHGRHHYQADSAQNESTETATENETEQPDNYYYGDRYYSPPHHTYRGYHHSYPELSHKYDDQHDVEPVHYKEHAVLPSVRPHS